MGLAVVFTARRLRYYFQSFTVVVMTDLPIRKVLQKLDIAGRMVRLQGSGVDVILEGPNGVLIEQALRFAFKESNNHAKYEAPIAGMLLTKELRAHHLFAKSDSVLVIGQVTDEYQAKDPQLALYLMCMKILKDAFYIFDLVHVPR
ncbi:uncharacterized protein [Phaseolus vulgaris]|uniref:uncharacterized protein n=1 Tax=Phaseolus vulgaris TaxID=3885 RepID=UPI0035CBC3B6